MANQPEPGARLGKYRILSHIATGGMGTVYKDLDEALDRVVALKVLPPEVANNPVLVERFRREARHASRLNHRNIVLLYDFVQADDYSYLVLEYVEGVDLAEHIVRRGKLPPEEARRLTGQAAKALDAAFEQGITHRDIKPSNFLLSRQGERPIVKMTDLGLARTINESEFRVTRDGTTVGTVDYMAPEQARDSTAADVRSDIYSLGCTLYHMLAGQPPFSEGGLGERLYKHLAVEPQDVRELSPEVPDGLWFVLQRMLAKSPDERYQTPAELIEALKDLPDEAPSLSAPPDFAAVSRSLPVPAAPPTRLAIRPPVPAMTPTVPSLPVAAPPSELLREVAPAASLAPPPPAPPPEPASPPSPTPRTKRRTTMPELELPPDTQAEQLGLSPEQVQAAAGQFERAGEVLQESGPTDYALQLLLSCCALDPTNLRYRRALREATRSSGAKRGSWLGSLSLGNMSARGKIKSARRAGEHLKVLEVGEKYLARRPEDISVQLEMAESAEELGLRALAVWLLEQARPGDTGTAVARALARVQEKFRRYSAAISLWEEIHKANPTDDEAAAKIKELSVNQTIARGKLRRESGQGRGAG